MLEDADIPTFRGPLVLDGRYVHLEPPSLDMAEELAREAADPEIWRYRPPGYCGTPETMRADLVRVIGENAAGTRQASVIRLKATGALVGVTGFMDIRRKDKGVEIGGTWLGRRRWRTPLNTECKYLLLQRAFEVEKVNRVQIKTDTRNVRSATAIARLGAVREGVLRAQMILPDGYVRDTVMFSIIAPEWPEVKRRLEGFLERPWTPPKET